MYVHRLSVSIAAFVLWTLGSGWSKAQAPAFVKVGAASEVAPLTAWIEAGASFNRLQTGAETAPWWSLRPVARAAPPALDRKGREWARNSIDSFVLKKLRDKGLEPTPEADRRTLLRRLTFDLHGLPPTPEEMDAFLTDPDTDAYEKVVDRLLASSRYGERWARHWMDLAHYAETHGHDQDVPRDHAWPYRDYLIASFNSDKPYRRFVEEQLAGDVLYPDDPQATVALGFLAAGPWDESSLRDIREDSIDRKAAQYIDRDDMIASVGLTFLSTTVQCARCHQHKFDPVSQQEYFGLQAVFAGVDRANRRYDADPAVHARRIALEKQRKTLQDGGTASTDKTKIDAEMNSLPAPKLVYAAAADFVPDGSFRPAKGSRTIHVLRRGDINQPQAVASPGALACVADVPFQLADPTDEGQRRAALARWIGDPRNPLTWRSIVNRVWHFHFGRGLVATPSDFGRMGSTPSHPELLDWLTAAFLDDGGSLKKLHRRIVTSASYRQGSQYRRDAAKLDADNVLLWRMNVLRLDAESLRDAVLLIAGQLDSTMEGPSVRNFAMSPGIHRTPKVDYLGFDPDAPGAHRRSVYRFIFRTVPDPFMDALDCPDASQFTTVRAESVAALQALALLNDPFMVRMSEHFAKRIENVERASEQARLAYRLALGREPTTHEAERLAAYAERHGLANACRLLFNCNEFVFVP